MSEAKRSSMMWGKDEDGCIYVSPFEHLYGDWVRHADYAKLRTERIHDLNQMGGQCEEIARLKAEVERLRKAGDAMAHSIDEVLDGKFGAHQAAGDAYMLLHIIKWTAAKESKPSV